MPEADKYAELIYAYSLGCLDREELVGLKEYLKSGGSFPWQELGDYQNLVAVFPAILKIEKPAPGLKDNVARRLYRLMEDKTPLPQKGKPEEETTEKAEKESASDELPKTDELTEQKEEKPSASESAESTDGEKALSSQENEPDLDLSDFEEVKSPKKDKNILASLPDADIANKEIAEKTKASIENTAGTGAPDTGEFSELPPSSEDFEKEFAINNMPEEAGSTEKSKKIIWPVIIAVLFILIAAGMTFMYLNISKEVKGYKSGIKELNDKVNDLSSKVNENQGIKKIFQSKDIQVINLIGTDLSPVGFGKLIIGTINRNCILQLADLPTLPNDKSYQLWIKEDGSNISAGVFNPSKSENYFHFTLPDVQLSNISGFILTEEPSGGSDTPGKNIYLTGSFK